MNTNLPEGMFPCPNNECKNGQVEYEYKATHDWSMSNNPSAYPSTEIEVLDCYQCGGKGYLTPEEHNLYLIKEKERQDIELWRSKYKGSNWGLVSIVSSALIFPSIVMLYLSTFSSLREETIAGVGSSWYALLFLVICVSIAWYSAKESSKRFEAYMDSRVQ